MNRTLIRKADELFRLHMLKIWGAPDRIQCCTCDNFFIPDFIDVGHIVPRGTSFQVRWVEDNVRPQCRHCNRNLYGNDIQKLVSEDYYQGLLALARDDRSFRLTDEYLQSIIEAYES